MKDIDAKANADQKDLENLLKALPDNPIPWAVVVRMVAPFIIRLAIRRALKLSGRSMSQTKINLVSQGVGKVIENAVNSTGNSEPAK